MNQIAANIISKFIIGIVGFIVIAVMLYFSRFQLCRILVGTSGANLEFCREEIAPSTQTVFVTEVVIVITATPMPSTETPAQTIATETSMLAPPALCSATVARTDIQNWETIGSTDKETTQTYINIFRDTMIGRNGSITGFAKGVTLPVGTLIATDFGNGESEDYLSYPVKPIAHYRSWGLFEVTNSFVAPNANGGWCATIVPTQPQSCMIEDLGLWEWGNSRPPMPEPAGINQVIFAHGDIDNSGTCHVKEFGIGVPIEGLGDGTFRLVRITCAPEQITAKELEIQQTAAISAGGSCSWK